MGWGPPDTTFPVDFSRSSRLGSQHQHGSRGKACPPSRILHGVTRLGASSPCQGPEPSRGAVGSQPGARRLPGQRLHPGASELH